MRRRVALFLGLVVVCAVAAGVYLVAARHRVQEAERSAPQAKVAPKGSLATFLGEDHVVFRSTGAGDSFGKVAVVPAADPGGPRAMTGITCDRVDVNPKGGLCLATEHGLVNSFEAIGLDAHLKERYHVDVPGIPSRVRVAPNGKVAAGTFFVAGDSYNPGTFSTRTLFIRMRDGAIMVSLEGFRVLDAEGNRITAIDQNYWGVTFAPDSRIFYATLGTGGKTYLVKGDLKTLDAKVIADGVECPSLSPDATRIAYKSNRAGALDTPDWRLHVLDLRTMKDHALSETRSVDDQVEWVDNHTIAYQLPVGDAGQMNVWEVRADGTGKPRLTMKLASSPSVSAVVTSSGT